MNNRQRLQQKLAIKAMHAQDFLKLLVTNIHNTLFPSDELLEKTLMTNPDEIYNKIIIPLKEYTQLLNKDNSVADKKLLEDQLNRTFQSINTTNKMIQNEFITSPHKLKISENFLILMLNFLRVLRHSCDKWNNQIHGITHELPDDKISDILKAAYTTCNLLLNDKIERPNNSENLLIEVCLERAHLAFFKTLLDIKYKPLEEISYTSFLLDDATIQQDFHDFNVSFNAISNPNMKLEFQQKYFISLCHYYINTGNLQKAKDYFLRARNLSDILIAKKIRVPIITLKATATLIGLLKNNKTIKDVLFYSDILIEQISDNISLLADPSQANLYVEFLEAAKAENECLKKYLASHYGITLNALLNNHYDFQLVIHTMDESLDTIMQLHLKVTLKSPDETSYLSKQLQIRNIEFAVRESDNAITVRNILTEHFPSIENAFKKFANRPKPILKLEQKAELEPVQIPEPEMPTTKPVEAMVTPVHSYPLYANFKHQLFIKLHPSLMLFLNEHHPKELQNLIAMCEVGRLLQNSKGKKGFIIKGGAIKAKDCSKDIRFFGESTKDKDGNLIFTLDSVRYKHDKGKLLTFK